MIYQFESNGTTFEWKETDNEQIMLNVRWMDGPYERHISLLLLSIDDLEQLLGIGQQLLEAHKKRAQA